MKEKIKEKVLNKNWVLPEELHNWYLEATKDLKKESFNPNAQKTYDKLTDEQKFIDNFIAHKVNERLEDVERITEKAKDTEFKKILKLPKHLIAKDKDDWEFEQFRICQQTAKEIFDEIEKVLSKRAKTYATKGMIKLSEPFSRGARTALFIFQTELQSLKKKFEMVE